MKEVLIEKGIKQTRLAKKLGKSFTIINSYACNRRQPSMELLFQIAEILQVNPKDLINPKDEYFFVQNKYKQLIINVGYI
ncbi:helix-turn-helix domain-containing protein [Hoylesella timonensis]|uniref:helix-turn-helix domain-containing protein n=1 Tax=Hoylesella timonensis TaxID=386414 RepID=UPI00336A7E1E